MSLERLTCPKCGSLNANSSVFCEDCGARLGLSPRQLTKLVVAERPKRVYNQCLYCGRPCLGRTCAGHRPLLKLEQEMERGAA